LQIPSKICGSNICRLVVAIVFSSLALINYWFGWAVSIYFIEAYI
jgi:hypothetical protein